jgi:hypothetical protein
MCKADMIGHLYCKRGQRMTYNGKRLNIHCLGINRDIIIGLLEAFIISAMLKMILVECTLMTWTVGMAEGQEEMQRGDMTYARSVAPLTVQTPIS